MPRLPVVSRDGRAQGGEAWERRQTWPTRRGGSVGLARVPIRPACGTMSTGATEPVGLGGMLILAAGVIGAAGITAASRGGTRGLPNLRFRHRGLLCVALLVQVGTGLLARDHRFIAVAVSYAIVAVWLLANAQYQRGRVRRALAVIAIGWVLNVIPMVLNHGMPVSRSALDSIGAAKTLSVREGHLFKHVVAGRHTALAPLGDVIPIRPLATIISVGDIVILVGLGMMLTAAMRKDGGPEPLVAAHALAANHHE